MFKNEKILLIQRKTNLSKELPGVEDHETTILHYDKHNDENLTEKKHFLT